MGDHKDLAARHRRVLPTWVALYYDASDRAGRRRRPPGHRRRGPRYLDFFGGILTTMTGHALPEVWRPIREQAERIAAHLHALPRSGSRSSWPSGSPRCPASPTPGSSSPPPAPRPTTPPCCWPPPTAAPTRCWRCATATTAGRSPRWASPATAPGRRRAQPAPGRLRCTAAYRLRSPLRHAGRRRRTSTRAWTTCARCSATATAGDVACLIAEPIQGVGGFAAPPDGLLRRAEGGARRARHPVHLRRGADRLGPHRRALLGLPGARRRPRTWSPSPRASATASPWAGWSARAEIMDSPAGQLASRPSAATRSSTAAGWPTCDYLLDHDLQANAARTGRDPRDGLRPPPAPRLRRRGARQGADARRRVRAARRPGTGPGAADGVLEACRAGGLLIGKGGLYGNVLRIAPPLSLTADEDSRGPGHPRRSHPASATRIRCEPHLT